AVAATGAPRRGVAPLARDAGAVGTTCRALAAAGRLGAAAGAGAVRRVEHPRAVAGEPAHAHRRAGARSCGRPTRLLRRALERTRHRRAVRGAGGGAAGLCVLALGPPPAADG